MRPMQLEYQTRRNAASRRRWMVATLLATLALILPSAVLPAMAAVTVGGTRTGVVDHNASDDETDRPVDPEVPPVDVPDVNPTKPTDPEAEVSGNDPLVVFGLAGLTFDDIDPNKTPNLWKLAERSALGNLSVRTVRSTSCPVDGWLTISAGRRSGTQITEDQEQRCPQMPDIAAGKSDRNTPVSATVDGYEDYTLFNAARDYNAVPGQLSAALADMGHSCSLAIGAGAATALADAQGNVPKYLPAGSVPDSLDECPLTMVDLGALGDSGWIPGSDSTVATSGGDASNVLPGQEPKRDDGTADAPAAPEPTAEEVARAADALHERQLSAADAALGKYLASTPENTAVMVTGLSDSSGDPALRAVMVSQPGGNEGLLTSASTRREGLVQLTDMTPTMLNLMGYGRDGDFIGTPAQYAKKTTEITDDDTPNVATIDSVKALRIQATASSIVHGSTGTFSIFLDTLHYIFFGLLGIGLFAGWRSSRLNRAAASSGRASALAWVGLVLAAIPLGSFLANLVPWADSTSPRLALLGSLVVATAAVLAVVLAGPWRRSWLGRVGALGLLTAITLGVDVAAGSQLQLNSLLGYNPIVAGRFYGLGNMAVALFIVGALMGTAAVVSPLVRTGHSRRAALVSAAIGVACVGVLGNPSWGAKFGGTIAALAGFIVLVLMLLKIRLNFRRLLIVGVVALAALVGIAGLDYLRPAEQRSHFGLFFGQLLDGEVFGVLGRKLTANLSIISINPLLSLIVPCALLVLGLFLGWCYRWQRTRRLSQRWAGVLPSVLDDSAAIRAGFCATMLALLAGLVITDSGIAVPATGLMLLIPTLVALNAGKVKEMTSADSPPPVKRATAAGSVGGTK
ncbi:hypothetical protein LWF01_03725 [Saxibacter everestensis]|uniref:Uncharacterized protein n=1 Tax=Saxibacter everestensis TaxID=2909229 RepID=A0ABY8QX99_9MICO|nr:hypothetical protein LWF01_03725 [Brevibacteriaceae bacterium ZFBP1038]